MSGPPGRGLPRIGIDLGGTKLSGIVLLGDGGVPVALRRPSPRHDYPATLAAIAALVADLERSAGLVAGQVPVGIGTPGAWVPRLGVMKNCNSTWLNGRPLLTDLTARLGPRVRIANDADCFALSEAEDGAAAGARVVFGVILGTGVGGGIVVDGLVRGGPNGLGGEWGHTPVPRLRQPVHVHSTAATELAALEARLAPRACYCGRWDCIETFLSGPGLATLHGELWGESAAPEDLAQRSDGRARQSLALHRTLLARSLAQVANLLDPDVIVLGGGLSNLPELAPALAEQMRPHLFDATGGAASAGVAVGSAAVAVTIAAWGDDSGVRGAARLWGLD